MANNNDEEKGECEVETCVKKVVDYGDRLCHDCFHDSVEEGECYCSVGKEEDDMHICGLTGGTSEYVGCEQKISADDTIMIGNTSFCIGCGEIYIEDQEEESS